MLTLVLPRPFVSTFCHDCAMLYTLLLHKRGIWPHGKYTDKSKCVIGLKFKGAAKSWASVIWPRFTEARRAAVNYINRRTKPLWLSSYGEDAEEILNALWWQWFPASAKTNRKVLLYYFLQITVAVERSGCWKNSQLSLKDTSNINLLISISMLEKGMPSQCFPTTQAKNLFALHLLLIPLVVYSDVPMTPCPQAPGPSRNRCAATFNPALA